MYHPFGRFLFPGRTFLSLIPFVVIGFLTPNQALPLVRTVLVPHFCALAVRAVFFTDVNTADAPCAFRQLRYLFVPCFQTAEYTAPLFSFRTASPVFVLRGSVPEQRPRALRTLAALLCCERLLLNIPYAQTHMSESSRPGG